MRLRDYVYEASRRDFLLGAACRRPLQVLRAAEELQLCRAELCQTGSHAPCACVISGMTGDASQRLFVASDSADIVDEAQLAGCQAFPT